MGISDIRVVVEFDTKRVIDLFNPLNPNGYTMVFTRNLRMGMKSIASLYAQTYLKHIRQSGIKAWKGHAEGMLEQQSIEPKTVHGDRGGSARDYVVMVPEYLVALNKFKREPHWVELRPNRSITKWYKEKIGGIQSKIIETSSGSRINPKTKRRLKSYYRIRVKSHPWIDSANNEARSYIIGILNNANNKTENEVRIR